ncbi:hypothetical protein TWF730_002933 [Orbilia blumenaviensis]|uniref:Uncharacterized protein n=1 Tax=Orbilia blumenaviensis TaxID=1796055 RepID=A0AAV9UBI2_9PEZI
MQLSFILASVALLATAQAAAINMPSTSVKRADVDCDKVVPSPTSLDNATKGECKVLCKWAKQSGNWAEFNENCMEN